MLLHGFTPLGAHTHTHTHTHIYIYTNTYIKLLTSSLIIVNFQSLSLSFILFYFYNYFLYIFLFFYFSKTFFLKQKLSRNQGLKSVYFINCKMITNDIYILICIGVNTKTNRLLELTSYHMCKLQD